MDVKISASCGHIVSDSVQHTNRYFGLLLDELTPASLIGTL
jgi:hypothetical protein